MKPKDEASNLKVFTVIGIYIILLVVVFIIGKYSSTKESFNEGYKQGYEETVEYYEMLNESWSASVLIDCENTTHSYKFTSGIKFYIDNVEYNDTIYIGKQIDLSD